MKRLLLDELKQWKDSKHRLPLVLRGARQVGKTWLLRTFGNECFNDVCYINFEQSNSLSAFFEGDLQPQRIIDNLSLYHGKKIQPQTTLIIFDEVQEVPRALTSLKYFAEQAPEYAICCAGSLLGIALHEGTSFPVGKVDFKYLYPMNFEEFLIANGKELVAEHLRNNAMNIPGMDNQLTEWLKTYYAVGGMPAAVDAWVREHDYFKVDTVQRQLLDAYTDDFSKHAPRNIVEKIRYVWRSIPSQLAKENKKFVYGLVREGARAREYEEALLWLNDMGLILRSFNITKPDVPLSAYEELKNFKVFLLDVGLLRQLSGLSPKTLIYGNKIFEEFKGAFTEQFVIQELTASTHLSCNHYWTSGAKAEMDFILSDGERVYPLEAKAETNIQAKSMHQYREKYKPALAFRSSLKPYHKDENLVNIPLYALFAIEKQIESLHY